MSTPAVRLGTNPIAWSNDDLRTLGADITLEQCLRETRAAGFDGIELGHKFPREAAQLGPILAAHDLVLVSGWYSTALLERSVDAEWRAMAGHLELLRALGCRVLIAAETTNAVHGDIERPLSARPRLDDGELARLAGRLTELAQRAAHAGITLAYHHHMGTVIQDDTDVTRLMDAAGDALHLLLDTGHAHFAGIDPSRLARDYGQRVAHVHCKDVRADRLEMALATHASFLDAVVAGVFTVPGDGALDFSPPLAALARAGYGGWLVVEAEQDPQLAEPAHYAGLGHANLRDLARAAGFAVAPAGDSSDSRCPPCAP